ncbi:hypothetical protein KAZ57_00350 [Patescibacteria group bacterium]|nr:hypothetical protein [Patescibacteria group bacterium]
MSLQPRDISASYEAYLRNHNSHLVNMSSHFVAYVDGKYVLARKDVVALVKRVQELHPDKDIFVGYVDPKAPPHSQPKMQVFA